MFTVNFRDNNSEIKTLLRICKFPKEFLCSKCLKFEICLLEEAALKKIYAGFLFNYLKLHFSKPSRIEGRGIFRSQ